MPGSVVNSGDGADVGATVISPGKGSGVKLVMVRRVEGRRAENAARILFQVHDGVASSELLLVDIFGPTSESGDSN